MSNAKEITQSKFKTLDLAYIAIGAALITICSWISIPMTVPFTLQTFAVFAVLLMLGGERGTLSTVVYVLLGAVGAPVFAGFTGGIGVLLGMTGGYIIGFIFMGLIYQAVTKFISIKFYIEALALLIGLAACYAFGTAWFMYVYTKNKGPISLATVLGLCVIPFIIPDVIKMALAFIISKRVRRYIK